ncbi:LLM class flavin-dependent oxidoreductase [Ureibacillus acetophenoni]|uniref:Probable LLM family oxidoreductase n=1 Tax=Ureibacillus acetophenoni TaxID=614649 RepID=A0A285U3R7_9BACL|nr:LLM class flavin-dependent oxidoreductase [Ureibacillus acetophenoni]SOC36068.1 probable LLM family oxidoreductase [Ureibacillus acetophenoni]
MSKFEIGVYTLADIGPNPLTGTTISAEERVKEIIEMAKLADEAGLDIFGVGEHHRLDYAVSSPAVILAAIAMVTKNIRLTSTTSVLSTLDPVRLFEDFAQLDLISGGRAEVLAGRGAFIESFPLFGYDLNDYNELFEEHLELFQLLNENEFVTWEGKFRSALNNAQIAPRPVQKEIPLWIGVGGTYESALRAGRLGVGMALAILGGDPIRFKYLVDGYFEAAHEAGHPNDKLKIGVTGHTYIADTIDQAREEFFPYYANYWTYVNKQRGMGFRITEEGFKGMTAPNSALFVGGPNEIVEKILHQYELFGHTRFMAQVDIGGVPFRDIERSIELLATKVAPVVKKAINK